MGLSDKEIKLTEGIQPGNLAPGINWQESNVESRKWVLLQFWATNDGKSRVANAQMHNAILSLGADRVQLVSVSLDENRSVFEGALIADKLNSETQFHKYGEEKQRLIKDYRLESGYGNWLIDENGIIVARNISPIEIAQYLER